MRSPLPALPSAAPPTLPLPATSPRLYGLDTLRGLAAILVVLLHAGIPYMTNPLQFLLWPARDPRPSSTVDAVTWCAECFLMPLFFVLAGFFSFGLLASRGERQFLKGRTRRLLSTQAAAFACILPLCLGIWILGWVADGTYVPQRQLVRGLPQELKAELFGIAHLWFLQYLYLYCLALAVGSWLWKRVRSNSLDRPFQRHVLRQIDRVLISVSKPLIPAVPCAVILFLDTRIVLGFYQTFLPVVSKLSYYAIYFFVGVALCRHRESLQTHARFGKRYLVTASCLFVAILPMIREHTVTPLTGTRLALMTVLLAVFAWCMTFGLVAISLRYSQRHHPVTQYLAEASFWVYLIHLPIVALAQIAIAPLAILTEAKFALAGAAAIALALLSYEACVRRTWVGVFLDGNRNRKTKSSTTEPHRFRIIDTDQRTIDVETPQSSPIEVHEVTKKAG